MQKMKNARKNAKERNGFGKVPIKGKPKGGVGVSGAEVAKGARVSYEVAKEMGVSGVAAGVPKEVGRSQEVGVSGVAAVVPKVAGVSKEVAKEVRVSGVAVGRSEAGVSKEVGVTGVTTGVPEEAGVLKTGAGVSRAETEVGTLGAAVEAGSSNAGTVDQKGNFEERVH